MDVRGKIPFCIDAEVFPEYLDRQLVVRKPGSYSFGCRSKVKVGNFVFFVLLDRHPGFVQRHSDFRVLRGIVQ